MRAADNGARFVNGMREYGRTPLVGVRFSLFIVSILNIAAFCGRIVTLRRRQPGRALPGKKGSAASHRPRRGVKGRAGVLGALPGIQEGAAAGPADTEGGRKCEETLSFSCC